MRDLRPHPEDKARLLYGGHCLFNDIGLILDAPIIQLLENVEKHKLLPRKTSPVRISLGMCVYPLTCLFTDSSQT